MIQLPQIITERKSSKEIKTIVHEKGMSGVFGSRNIKFSFQGNKVSFTNQANYRSERVSVPVDELRYLLEKYDELY